MTPDKHQRERMRLWARMYVSNFVDGNPPGRCSDFADTACAEFDKRFPAPAAVEPVPAEPPMLFARTLAAMEERDAAAELAALREKARLFDKLCEELPPGWKQNLRYWDAVASGKVDLVRSADGDGFYANYKFRATAAEAVQAAIDAGALK